jgi:hypothetical protein
MCSCSGSCNCNSTTIPRGPQGVPGPSGNAATITVGNVAALPAGSTPTITNGGSSSAAVFNFGIPAGTTGGAGSNGVNAFTTLTALFVQPAPNSTVTIAVANSSWAAVDQIIYIGDSIAFPDPGGFYKVVSIPLSTSMVIMRMDWTIPGVTFRATTTAVGGAGTIVTPSGTIGPSINEISVLGFDEDIRLTSISVPGGFQNTSSFTIPANSITSINDWIEIEFTVKIDFNDGWTGSPDIRSFQLQINPDGYGSTYSIGGISSGLFGVVTVTNFKLKLYYGGLNGISQTKLIGDSLAITNNSTTNIALNYTNIPGSGSAGDSYLVRTNQAAAITLFDGALYSWNNATSSWDGFTGYGTQSTRGFSLNTNSSTTTTYDPIELADDILITPRFQCYDTTDVVVTNFKITKYTS